MTYKEAMAQTCSCKRYGIGGWIGTKKEGSPNFLRMSVPVVVDLFPIMLCDEHTKDACFEPRRMKERLTR